jgi:hypothetical protein
LKLAALLLLAAALLFADGGSVLLRKQSGGLLITVFGTPQAGATDFSVLVQNAENRAPVLDANVTLQIGNAHVRATHEQATDKLLYAAPMKLAHAGKSHLEVTVAWHEETASIDGDINVASQAPPLVAYWPYFALVPAAILLFALNRWLKGKRRVRRLEAPP